MIYDKLFTDQLTICNLKIVFTSPIRIKSIFTSTDKLPKMLLSGHAYKYKCGDSNTTYYRKSKRHFKAWNCEHLGILHITGKKVKIDNNKRSKNTTSYVPITLHPPKTFLFFYFKLKLLHDGGRYHIETRPLICRANQWTGFYVMRTSVMKELN